jgi:hypothetical protein
MIPDLAQPASPTASVAFSGNDLCDADEHVDIVGRLEVRPRGAAK